MNLRSLIGHTVKTVANRLDEAVSALATFLNTMVFAPQGPHKAPKQFLVPETHTGSVLKAFLPDGYEGCVFPSSTKEAKHLPLGTDTPLIFCWEWEACACLTLVKTTLFRASLRSVPFPPLAEICS